MAIKRNAIAALSLSAAALVGLHNLSTEDLMLQPRRTRVQRQPVAPKFRDPVSGATWTGRGRAPRWLEGKDKEAYRI